RVKRFKRIIYVHCSNRLVAAFLGNRTVVRGSISAAMALSLVLFGLTGFWWMVGPQPGSHDWLSIGKGHPSDSHISTGLARALPREFLQQ
ncbi:MAG TPA: hypothetical protein VN857_01915, partial [Chthoniobacterales bacterium]|nr:hypothetical protein [Chthoniobacterales bacterium]